MTLEFRGTPILVQCTTIYGPARRCQVKIPPFNIPTPWSCQNPTLLWSKSHPIYAHTFRMWDFGVPNFGSVWWDFGHKKVGFWQNQGVGLLKGGNLTCDPARLCFHNQDSGGGWGVWAILTSSSWKNIVKLWCDPLCMSYYMLNTPYPRSKCTGNVHFNLGLTWLKMMKQEWVYMYMGVHVHSTSLRVFPSEGHCYFIT